MSSTTKIVPAEFIDKAGMTPFAIGQLVLVIFCGIFEGMDFMLVSYTMPQISAEWNLDAIATGSLSSWAMIGCVIGGLVGGAVADKIGRKSTMIWSVVLFSVFTIPVAFAPNFAMFAIFRVVAGLAIGSALPLTVSMAAENAPTRLRSLVTGISCGATPLGYVVASAVSMVIVPAYGWRPVFLVATVGLVFVVLLVPLLMETPFWALANGREKAAVKYLNKVRVSAHIDIPEITVDQISVSPKPASGVKKSKTGYAALFSSGKLAFVTIGAALIYFFAMFTLYGINAWYPTLMVERGLSVTRAYGFSLAMNFAGIIGNIVAGTLVQKLGVKRGEGFGFTVGCIVILIMAWVNGPAGVLVIEALLVGFFINYMPPSVNAATPGLFPTNARGSGVSFVMSVGRFAGMLAPVIAGSLLAAGLDYSGLITVFALSPIVSLILAFVFFRQDNANTSLADIEE